MRAGVWARGGRRMAVGLSRVGCGCLRADRAGTAERAAGCVPGGVAGSVPRGGRLSWPGGAPRPRSGAGGGETVGVRSPGPIQGGGREVGSHRWGCRPVMPQGWRGGLEAGLSRVRRRGATVVLSLVGWSCLRSDRLGVVVLPRTGPRPERPGGTVPGGAMATEGGRGCTGVGVPTRAC